jgi:N-acetylmuramoyl-L-alanine amidase
MALRAARRTDPARLSVGALVCCLLATSVSPSVAQSTRPTIVIDPGHPSEVSSGANVQNGTSEVHVAWQVAQQLSAILTARGYRVVMTKSREKQMVTNIERAAIGNRETAALVVRLHCDASSDSGYAIYYPDRTGTAHGKTGPSADVMQRSATAAESTHVSMARTLGNRLKDGGVRGDSKTAVGSQQGALTGSIFSNMPVVLIEMVTLSNARDAQFIKNVDNRNLMARAIADGVARYVPLASGRRKE